jgi:hypothetical protein
MLSSGIGSGTSCRAMINTKSTPPAIQMRAGRV